MIRKSKGKYRYFVRFLFFSFLTSAQIAVFFSRCRVQFPKWFEYTPQFRVFTSKVRKNSKKRTEEGAIRVMRIVRIIRKGTYLSTYFLALSPRPYGTNWIRIWNGTEICLWATGQGTTCCLFFCFSDRCGEETRQLKGKFSPQFINFSLCNVQISFLSMAGIHRPDPRIRRLTEGNAKENKEIFICFE